MSRIKCALVDCPDCLAFESPRPDCTTCQGSGFVWKEPKRTEVRKTEEGR